MPYPRILFVLLLVCSLPAVSDEEKSAHDVINLARDLKLDSHPTWLGLLLFDNESKESKIISKGFFLSSVDRVDPRTELEATISQLFRTRAPGEQDHPVCRFPARYIWLDRNLNLPEVRRILVTCQDYQAWTLQGDISSVSIVYSTGYLKNPASYYGHILIKFNSGKDIPLMDTSVDHGAILDENDSLPVYIFKGLTGGYEAGFTHSIFYQKSHNYGEIELRDLWEYQLSLTNHELELLVAHAWELIGNKTTYFFIDENCATAVADLLKVVIQEDIQDSRFFWTVPSTVFQSLYRIDQKTRSLIADVRLIPSRQTRFAARYDALIHSERNSLKRLIDQQDSGDKLTMTEDASPRVLATLLDYYRLRSLQYPGDETYQESIQDTLNLIMRFEPEEPPDLKYNRQPPHESQPPTTIRIGAIHNRKLGTMASFRFRPVYFDRLSRSFSLPRHSALALFDTEVHYSPSRDSYDLARLDVFNAQTLNVDLTDLNDEVGLAWKFRLTWERESTRCHRCTVPKFISGIGTSFRLNDQIVPYVMSDLTVQEDFENSGPLLAGFRGGILIRASSLWASMLELEYKDSIDGSRSSQAIFRWEQRFGDGRNWDIRLSYIHNEVNEISASISIYL